METKLRFKVGDKVRVKSLEWYNRNKDVEGFVYDRMDDIPFKKGMSKWCGKIVQIREVYTDGYWDTDASIYWKDWMLEDEVVTEEKKEQLNKNYMKEILTKEMTKEEVYSFLRDTEIVCNSIEESKKVQEKLFALGISYSLRDVVTERGLLFITEDLCISNSIDYDYFLSHNVRRVDPSEILAIQIKEKEAFEILNDNL